MTPPIDQIRAAIQESREREKHGSTKQIDSWAHPTEIVFREALEIAITALEEIEDLQPIHERDRRIISRQAIQQIAKLLQGKGKE
jgi:hypothetical protein